MNELVSVVIPVIEFEYFEIAIKSILEQTYHNLEIIIIDGSEDEKIKNYLESMKDDRIKYFYRKKNGIADALNYGLSQASGTYIARMDADDISEPNRIYEEVKYLREHQDVSVVSSMMKLIDAKGNIIGETEKPVQSNDEIKIKFIFGCPVAHPTVMFRSELIQEGWKYQNVFSEDYDLWTRMIIKHKFKILPKSLLKYRIHENNESIVNKDRVRASVNKSLKHYLAELLELDLFDYEDYEFMFSFSTYKGEKVNGSYDLFLKKQINLIRMMREKVEICCSNVAKTLFEQEIKKYWDSLLKKSYALYLTDDFMKMDLTEEGYHSKCKVLEESDRHIFEMKNKGLSFVLYGYGKRGYHTLERFSKVVCDQKLEWSLVEVIDAKEQVYMYQGEEKQTISNESISKLNIDYVLISTSVYFDEIREELIKIGISEKKIIWDNFLYYL